MYDDLGVMKIFMVFDFKDVVIFCDKNDVNFRSNFILIFFFF